MSTHAQSIRERQLEFLQNWRAVSERLLDNKIRFTKQVMLSHKQDQHVTVTVAELAEGFEARIAFRDSLRFQDMGAGAGWRKGVKLSQDTYQNALEKYKPRKQKKLINRASFARLHWLEEVLGGYLTSEPIITTEKIII